MTRDELLALAERVERLDGPNYAIECEIGRAYNPHWTRYSVPKNFTASLDAAMTLVGTNWTWRVTQGPRDALATVVHPECEHEEDRVYTSKANTPAQALTAACLRARAEEIGK